MAPEIAVEPEKADTRADLYSLGVTAYHMLTGKLPFEGKTTVEVIMKHVLDAPTPLHDIDRGIPEDLSKIIMKLMEKKPENRYQSAAEVVKALEYRNIAEGLMATF
jgi:serine/threonine protein kinase